MDKKKKKQLIFFKKILDSRKERLMFTSGLPDGCHLISVLNLSSCPAMSWRSLIFIWYSLQLLSEAEVPNTFLEAACNSQVLTSASGLKRLCYDRKSPALFVRRAWNVALWLTISRGSERTQAGHCSLRFKRLKKFRASRVVFKPRAPNKPCKYILRQKDAGYTD